MPGFVDKGYVGAEQGPDGLISLHVYDSAARNTEPTASYSGLTEVDLPVSLAASVDALNRIDEVLVVDGRRGRVRVARA
jgi:hypothetical protein